MAIVQFCCCWNSLRTGCFASAFYTMVIACYNSKWIFNFKVFNLTRALVQLFITESAGSKNLLPCCASKKKKLFLIKILWLSLKKLCRWFLLQFGTFLLFNFNGNSYTFCLVILWRHNHHGGYFRSCRWKHRPTINNINWRSEKYSI